MNRIFSSNLLPRSIFPSLRASSFLSFFFPLVEGVDKGQQTRNDGCVDRGDTHPYRIHIRTPRSPTLGHRHGLCKWTNVTLDPREQVEYDRRCASGECGVPTTRTWSFRVRRFLSSRRRLSPTRFFLASGEDRRRKREGGKKKSCTNGPSVRSWTIRFGTIRIVTDRLFRNSFLLLDFWILGGGNLPDRGFYFIRAPSMETWRRILERNKILRWSTNICRSECATDCSSCFFFCPPVIISITRVLSTFGFSRVCKISRGVGEMECERRGIIRSPLLTSRYFI